MPKYYFPKGTPLHVKILFAFMIGNVVVLIAVFWWAASFAPHQPSATHSFPMQWRGGIVTFVSPHIGHYLFWGFWLNGALIIALGSMLWWHAKKGRAVRVR